MSERIEIIDGLTASFAWEAHILSCPECKGTRDNGWIFPILRVDKPCPEAVRLNDLVEKSGFLYSTPKISLEEFKKRRFDSEEREQTYRSVLRGDGNADDR